MYSLPKLLFGILCLAFILVCCGDSKPPNSSISIGRIETIQSEILNEERTVWVHVPENDNRNASIRYPVLYLLDGDAHFKSVVGLMHQLSSVNGNMFCPKMVVVAILNTNRGRDLTPSTDESQQADSKAKENSGGGELFTGFIADELIPYIDKNYQTTNQRTLVGHSLGGLMVINTMVKHGELFDKYLAIDPSLWWNDGKSLLEYQQALQTNSFKGKSLFIGIANTISMDTLSAQQDTTTNTSHYRAIVQFINALKRTPNHELDWKAKYYPDESHGSVALISEYDAFRFLYRKIPVQVAFAQLRKYEGRFSHQFPEGESFLNVVAKENLLGITESWRNIEMQFRPIGDRNFYSFEEKFSMRFNLNDDGEVVEFVAFENDVWTKIE